MSASGFIHLIKRLYYKTSVNQYIHVCTQCIINSSVQNMLETLQSTVYTHKKLHFKRQALIAEKDLMGTFLNTVDVNVKVFTLTNSSNC